MIDAAFAGREMERQQRLLQAIRDPGHQGGLSGWVRDGGRGALNRGVSEPSSLRGLMAYAVNAGALAQRALEANYPTVRALLGEEAFAGLAREAWRCMPPMKGDLAWFGGALPEFLSEQLHLADWPYLSDVARLDWMVARAECAFDVEADVGSFELLGREDPAGLMGVLASGMAWLDSPWPVATLWTAHHGAGGAAEAPSFSDAREALALQRAECALVWRSGWRVQVAQLPVIDRAFVKALVQRASLAEALDQAGEDFDLSACLQRGLQQGWWVGMAPCQASSERHRACLDSSWVQQEGSGG